MGAADDSVQKRRKSSVYGEVAEEEKEEEDDDDDDDDEDDIDEEFEGVKEIETLPILKIEDDVISDEKKETKKRTKEFVYKWWLKRSIFYAFRHPLVTSRLEKLMGSNYVYLTDRDYMLKLQQRILVEFANATQRRIKQREMREMERVKDLVLTGKVPFADAPPEMYDHPVMVIERYCQKLIAERRAKIKVPKVNIPNHLYWDDTIDPPSGLSIEKGHMFRDMYDKLCIPPDRFLETNDEDDIEDGYMLTQAAFDKLRYEDPQIKELKDCQTVEELYELSDQVIGTLKTMQPNTTIANDNI